MNTPSGSVKREMGSDWIHFEHDDAAPDAWKWGRGRFWSVTMHSNGTLPLTLTLDDWRLLLV